MEGHHAELEGQAADDKDQAKNQHLMVHMSRDNRLEHRGDIQRAGGTIQHGHTVEQETGGHGTQHKVLDRSLGGSHVVTAQCDQRVAGQGQQLQTQVNHQEVVAGDHHEHAQQGEKGERKQLPTAQHAAIPCVGAPVDQGDHGGHGGKALQPIAHGVADHHVAKAVVGGTTGGVHGLQEGHHRQRQQGQGVGSTAQGGLDAQVKQGNHAGHAEQQHLGIGRDPTDIVNHHLSLNSIGSVGQLGQGHMLEQLRDRCIHHIREGLGIDTHVQNRCSQQGHDQELTRVDIQQVLDMVVAHRAQVDALEHPQRVGGAKDQGTGGGKTDPEVELDRTQNHHPLADKASGSRQAAIGHGEQQGKGRKLGHGVDHATIGSDFTGMHPVIQHTDGQEHGGGDKAVGNHLHNAARHTEVREDKETQSHKTHVRHR